MKTNNTKCVIYLGKEFQKITKAYEKNCIISNLLWDDSLR